MGRAIKVEKGTFSWGKSIKPILSNINIDVSEGELVAIVGSVGAGKSSILSAMLGEMEVFHGKVASKGKIAYVSQQAWILNATVRENILFGSQMNKKQYKRAIEACALQEDLKMLSGGDLTEIGEKGVTLSGGQKQRISLARAVYTDADVYLFDDPLSAVDSHVGKHIFKRVISDSGILKYKTRVFVTHAVHWLPLVDTVILLKEGKILESGSYIKLMRRHGYLADFLYTFYVEHESEHEEEDPEVKELKSKVWDHVETVTSTSEGANSSDDNIVIQRSKWKSSPTESEVEKSIDIYRSISCSSSRQISRLIDEEKTEVGRVRFAVFIAYAKAIGMCSTLFIFIFYTLYQGSSVAANILLSTWTDDPELQNLTLSQTSSYINKNHQYLTLFGVFGILQAVFILIHAAIANTQMVKAAGKLHSKMLTSIVKAPMSFFETTPIGRIVNRFSRDIETIDNLIPSIFSMWILTIFSVTSTILVICVTTPLFTIVVIPLVFMYTAIQKFFVPTSRQLKRLESVTKSPIYSHFGESIQGSLNIRAYEARERFVKDSRSLIDKNQIYYFAGISANRWLGIWIEFISSCVVFAAALFSLLSPGATGGSLGLSVTYALQITSSLKWLVRTLSDLETNIVSVERVKEYSELKSEGSWMNRHNRPPVDWPEAGNIQFQLYSTRYRPGLDLVLKIISCDIKPGEKIGIVGRTGAGKSSFVLALFRLVESVAGSIYIDDRRIDDMGLHDLRSKLTILPQDPVLFAGSLRMNLDPFGCYNDEDIWTALTLAHLKVYVKSLPGGLSYDCGEGGQNFSVGQRQLVCLARALLRKTKVLILDEATAAVDLMTDNLIQETVRSEFKDCTILTVAHRINTIMDYDRVMVLGGGKIIEFDKPAILLQDEESSFYDLAKDADII
ncbi:ATP-binding cassette sub-family C member 3-like [Patella vulgata]|uniref:ATP-binding cassette sub-family C member 3-like n=1 Tax=Patella vulgata TaxID=6465 RepID=UPI0024A92275|nr:ATP-binding cassette sub-family C member 3-like [Patella vulgata]